MKAIELKKKLLHLGVKEETIKTEGGEMWLNFWHEGFHYYICRLHIEGSDTIQDIINKSNQL